MVGVVVGVLMATLSKTTNVSISIEGYAEDNPPTIEIGDFPYEKYSLVVTKNSKKSETVTLSEDMIDGADLLKIYQEGEQTLTIKYGGATCTIKIIVKRKQLSNITFNDLTVTYTGRTISMEVDGDIPADVTVRYPNGNTFTNVGEYDVLAVVYGDAYTTLSLTAHLAIVRATYDMTDITFKDKEFTYDGDSKSISISGELPTGVRVSYSIGDKKGNSATDAGTYSVVASFSSSNANYNDIAPMTASLVIKKASYTVTTLSMDDLTETYDGKSHSLSLADESLVPRGVEIVYYIRKVASGSGDSVSNAFEKGNSAINAGKYEVKAEFTLPNPKNYNAIEPVTATLTIEQATYSLDVHFYSAIITYDGNAHSFVIKGATPQQDASLPEGMTVSYTIRRTKDENGEEVTEGATEGNSATNIGTYVVTAIFTHNNDNYKQVDSVDGTFIIEGG